jgi:hypothetical protein
MKLENYVGRVVRLKKSAFEEIARRARRREKVFENCFLVAGISTELRQLICYGADLRIMVGASEVVLI